MLSLTVLFGRALQELRAEEDRIYNEWMRAAESAAQEARMAYHERRRQQLMQVPGRRCQLAQRPPATSAVTCCRCAGTAACCTDVLARRPCRNCRTVQ